jgi:hypothetical protein
MTKWLREYDRLRTGGESNEMRISNKYDFQELHWKHLQEIYLPEMEMNWGHACGALKKS